ncbi:MAG TPA: GGDEF domain-containing protein, partial [Armatimonadota bacterium]|nr:GGDEF domain-containing protein [Armatimonadota bacterium]
GHVYGDQVLRAVAGTLRELVDPEVDCLCRYGGDEFAVATVRPLPEARALAERIRDEVATIRVNGEETGVSIAIGLAGGRRHRPRPESHVSATLDDLITRASTASTAAKHASDSICLFQNAAPAGPAEVAPPSGGLPRVVLLGYEIAPVADEFQIRVALRAGSVVHEQRDRAEEASIARGLVAATARCLEQFAHEPLQVVVEETYEYSTPQGLSCVGATISMRFPDGHVEHLVGASAIRGDIYRTYVNAVLDATNRRLQAADGRDYAPAIPTESAA